MTYSMIVGKYKLIFSDTHFKDFRKKPTISVYDADTNSETKIASFNSQETFEWFIEAVVEADRKTEPTISKMEQVDKDISVGSKDEPQTDYGDFADRLAYERGVKHAWEVAQKVFCSTVTFYEAEDVAKQIDKDINVRSKDEPQTEEEKKVREVVRGFMNIVNDMRNPTEEEKESVNKYIESISKPTGINVFELMDEPQTERSSE